MYETADLYVLNRLRIWHVWSVFVSVLVEMISLLTLRSAFCWYGLYVVCGYMYCNWVAMVRFSVEMEMNMEIYERHDYENDVVKC